MFTQRTVLNKWEFKVTGVTFIKRNSDISLQMKK